ncbi:MAG: DUF7948 domain-containing protein, partial [Candidatus Heimdallarchaeota archaeon]
LGDNLLSLTFDDAYPVTPIGINEKQTRSNFFLGNRGTYTNVRHFDTVVYNNLWQGIDLNYFTTAEGLKYEFIVQPGANPENIKITCEGFDSLSITDNQLVMNKQSYSFIDEGLVVYQEDSKTIQAKFASISTNSYGFDIENYDHSQKLIIDPIIYSTFLGGNAYEIANSIKVDGSGNIYVCGSTVSSDFPVENGYDSTHNSGSDVFVTKFSSSGSIIYSTFIGGSSDESATDIALDGSNNVYVIGSTWSSDFPVVNPYQAIKAVNTDCFVLKLSADGSTLVYSTFVGGDAEDSGLGIAVNSTGHAHVVGGTLSSDFPLVNELSMGIYDDNNGILLVLSPSGDSLTFSTLFGGNGVEAVNAIALVSNIAYLTGRTQSSDLATSGSYEEHFQGETDCFVAKVDITNPSLEFATYVAGANFDTGLDIAVDNSGGIFVAGFNEGDFPTVSAYDSTFNGIRDAFVFKMLNDGTDLTYSSYLGGSQVDVAYGLTIVPATGVVYVTGKTESDNYPTVNPYDNSYNGLIDCFVTKLSADGSTISYSTFIGGDAFDYGKSIAIDTSGNMYVAGITGSSNFPTVNAYDSSYNNGDDAFVLILDEVAPTETPTTPPTNGGDETGWFNKIVGGLQVWVWFTMGGSILILAIFIPVLVISLKKRRAKSDDLKEKPLEDPDTLSLSKIEEDPPPVKETPKPSVEHLRVEPTSIVPTIQGATPLTPENRAPIGKRILAGIFEYGVPLFMIAAGGFFAGTATITIQIVAGVIVSFAGIFSFFASHVLILVNKRMFSGITSGKGFAKLRVVKVVDSKNMIIQPMPKNKKGIMIARAFLAFFGFITFPLYLLVSLIIVISSKYNRSLLDLITGTAVIIFDNKAEMLKLKGQD